MDLDRRLAHIPVLAWFIARWWRKTGRWPVSCGPHCGWSGRQREWPAHVAKCSFAGGTIGETTSS